MELQGKKVAVLLENIYEDTEFGIRAIDLKMQVQRLQQLHLKKNSTQGNLDIRPSLTVPQRKLIQMIIMQ